MSDRAENLKRENEELIRGFVKKILHGDEVHRDWLIRAGEQYLKDGSVPPPTQANLPAITPEMRDRIKYWVNYPIPVQQAHWTVEMHKLLRDLLGEQG